MTIIPIVIGAFGTVTKGLLKALEDLEIRGRAETIQTITLNNVIVWMVSARPRTTRILRMSWRLEETWCHSNSSKKSSANAVKALIRVRNLTIQPNSIYTNQKPYQKIMWRYSCPRQTGRRYSAFNPPIIQLVVYILGWHNRFVNWPSFVLFNSESLVSE